MALVVVHLKLTNARQSLHYSKILQNKMVQNETIAKPTTTLGKQKERSHMPRKNDGACVNYWSSMELQPRTTSHLMSGSDCLPPLNWLNT